MIDIRYRVRTTAFHEAGHAFAAVHYDIRFLKVWILERTDFEDRSGDTLGQLTRIAPVNKPDYFGILDAAKAEAVLAFCGPFAERLAYPELNDPDFARTNLNDFNDARSILRFATTSYTQTKENPFLPEDLARTKAEVEQLLGECAQDAVELVNSNEPAIRRIAEALLDSFEVPADDVVRLCRVGGT